MYRIDRAANRITMLTKTMFAELGFTERGHLQEWLAHRPDALGEELLIIQKEFAGFDDTKERLDLLALDKTGTLVIIENKLDDSGRDVVWQSLKYASYCSTLSKTNIVEIYQQYLDGDGDGGNAQQQICTFVGKQGFDEVVLNAGNEQRIIMVAAQFRKEVTSTVLWLLNHGLHIQCFKATPFKEGELLLLNLEQVIPLPEAEEFMIGISNKEREERTAELKQNRGDTLRVAFWQRTLDALRHATVDMYKNVNSTKDYWLTTGSGLSGVEYEMVFGKSEVRIQFDINRPSKEENKKLFDYLEKRRDQFEKAFGASLEWQRLPKYRLSLIIYRQEFLSYDERNWDSMIQWLVEYIQKLKATFHPEIDNLRRLLIK